MVLHIMVMKKIVELRSIRRAADIIASSLRLGLESGVLVAVPIPLDSAPDGVVLE